MLFRLMYCILLMYVTYSIVCYLLYCMLLTLLYCIPYSAKVFYDHYIMTPGTFEMQFRYCLQRPNGNLSTN